MGSLPPLTGATYLPLKRQIQELSYSPAKFPDVILSPVFVHIYDNLYVHRGFTGLRKNTLAITSEP